MLKRMLTLTLVMLLPALNMMAQFGGQAPRFGGGNTDPAVPNSDPAAINLLRNCDSARQSARVCDEVPTGAMLGIDASEDVKDVRSICFKQNAYPSNADLLKVFREYVRSHPNKLNGHIGHVAYRAFLEAYPCKK